MVHAYMAVTALYYTCDCKVMTQRYTILILDAENEGERVLLIFLQASPSVLKTSLGSGSSVRTLGKGCKH
jgi:hypothetical protein